jgi:aminoglycoside 6'-N-acetyltransferase
VDIPTLTAERLTLRPLTDADMERLAAILAEPSVAEWWGPDEGRDALEEELRNEGRAFAVEVGGEVAGWLGFDEETTPGYAYASVDIVLGLEHQSRGLGPEALRLVIRWLIEAHGHRRFTIDPAAANARAIRAYEAVGFKPVGVMRSYEQGRDGSWHDNLLMDLLAEELGSAAGGGRA